LNFNKYKIIISGIVLGVLYWIIEAIMDKFVFHFDGDLIHHLFFTDAHEIWMRSMTILFIVVSSVYSQIICNKVKTNEQKLEEKVHLLLDTIPDALYIIDQETGKILDVNKAAEKMYGYSREEWLQMKNTDVSAEPDKTEKATYKLPSQIPIRYHKKKDGTIFPLEMMVSSYTTNDQRLIIATGRDITERKKSEEELMKYHDHLEELVEERTKALKESERFNQFLFDSLPIGLALCRLDGSLVNVNPAFAKTIGRSIEETLKLTYWDITPKKYEKQEQAQLENLEKTGHYGPYEKEYIHKYEHLVPVRLLGLIIEKEGEQNIWSSVEDITERKLAEENLKRAMEDLKRSNAELEQFAYVASHDLQEPLRMVASFTQLLERRYKDKLDDDANDFINFIVDGTSRMQALINDLLIFSRIGTRGKTFNATDMNIVLENVLTNIRQSIKETNATITNDPLHVIIADDSQMMQLFQNLISNAVKFHGEEAPIVHVSGEDKEEDWVFSVRDNGIGIDSNNFDRIFVIFQRVHKKDEYSGTGIG